MYPELAAMLSAMADAITALSVNRPEAFAAVSRMNEARARLALTLADIGQAEQIVR